MAEIETEIVKDELGRIVITPEHTISDIVRWLHSEGVDIDTIRNLYREQATVESLRREAIESEVETYVTYSLECPNCGTFYEREGANWTEQEFVDDMVEQFFYAESDMYGLMGLVCNDCFVDPEDDWEEIQP